MGKGPVVTEAPSNYKVRISITSKDCPEIKNLSISDYVILTGKGAVVSLSAPGNYDKYFSASIEFDSVDLEKTKQVTALKKNYNTKKRAEALND